jgi:Aldehyde dehydrogenase family
MIPMWKFSPAIACGNAFILKPSERDRSVPMRLGQLMIEAGLPPGILRIAPLNVEIGGAALLFFLRRPGGCRRPRSSVPGRSIRSTSYSTVISSGGSQYVERGQSAD